MPTLPHAVQAVILSFEPVFSKRVFEHARLLIVGTYRINEMYDRLLANGGYRRSYALWARTKRRTFRPTIGS